MRYVHTTWFKGKGFHAAWEDDQALVGLEIRNRTVSATNIFLSQNTDKDIVPLTTRKPKVVANV
jgi:hypothetical protein